VIIFLVILELSAQTLRELSHRYQTWTDKLDWIETRLERDLHNGLRAQAKDR